MKTLEQMLKDGFRVNSERTVIAHLLFMGGNCPNVFVAAVWNSTMNYWIAYIGGESYSGSDMMDEMIEEECVKIAKRGGKLSKEDAERFFPMMSELGLNYKVG